MSHHFQLELNTKKVLRPLTYKSEAKRAGTRARCTPKTIC